MLYGKGEKIENVTYGKGKYHLSFEMAKYVREVFLEWIKYIPVTRKGYPDMSKFKSFKEYRDKFIEITHGYFIKKYPNTKYEILQFKKSVELTFLSSFKKEKIPEEEYNVIAFKLTKDMPELYLLVSEEPMILDECTFNAYEGTEGVYIHPQWNFN